MVKKTRFRVNFTETQHNPTLSTLDLRYFEQKISSITAKYRRVFAWGGSMGGQQGGVHTILVSKMLILWNSHGNIMGI